MKHTLPNHRLGGGLGHLPVALRQLIAPGVAAEGPLAGAETLDSLRARLAAVEKENAALRACVAELEQAAAAEIAKRADRARRLERLSKLTIHECDNTAACTHSPRPVVCITKDWAAIQRSKHHGH